MKKNVILLLTILLATQTLAFEFCEDGQTGTSDLRLISIDDMLKDNSKEWTWSPSEEIEIEARVENKKEESTTYILEAIFTENEEEIKIAENSDDLKEEFALSSGERKSISLEFKIDEDMEKGDFNLHIKLYEKNEEEIRCTENSEETITIEKIELCENGNVKEDELEITKINDEKEDNEIEWQWTPGNNIEVLVNIKNSDYSKREFLTELILLDENKNQIKLAENSDNTKKQKTIDEDESEEINFYFKLKSDIKEGTYYLYAKTYDENNENICTSLKAQKQSSPKTIEIKRSERNVIVKEVKGPSTAETFSNVQYTATIANLGSKDEERVLGVIYNLKLGLKEKLEIRNLESGQEEIITFNFTIPENASLSRHAILFSTEFEYNEKQDYYKSYSDENDDIKKYLTISEGIKTTENLEEAIENDTIQMIEEIVKNETIEEIVEIIENETSPTTTITGNVIGPSSRTSLLPIFLIIVTLATITFFTIKIKKPKHCVQNKHIQPNITRKYTAKLD